MACYLLGGRMKILVVDDSQTDSFFIGGLLRRAGYAVEFACDGVDGIEKAIEQKPDLIVMDIVMPRLDGFGATTALANNRETKAIPVVMCTTRGHPADKAQGMALGARAYIVKPVNPQELIDTVRSVLETPALAPAC